MCTCTLTSLIPSPFPCPHTCMIPSPLNLCDLQVCPRRQRPEDEAMYYYVILTVFFALAVSSVPFLATVRNIEKKWLVTCTCTCSIICVIMSVFPHFRKYEKRRYHCGALSTARYTHMYVFNMCMYMCSGCGLGLVQYRNHGLNWL